MCFQRAALLNEEQAHWYNHCQCAKVESPVPSRPELQRDVHDLMHLLQYRLQNQYIAYHLDPKHENLDHELR